MAQDVLLGGRGSTEPNVLSSQALEISHLLYKDPNPGLSRLPPETLSLLA